ncbi:hypothetical protein MUN38_02840 [Corynebacterium callunae]|nr:hypothetical protein [Corynebacterium callunae]
MIVAVGINWPRMMRVIVDLSRRMRLASAALLATSPELINSSIARAKS